MRQHLIIVTALVLIVLIAGIVRETTRPPDTETLISRAIAADKRQQVLRAAESGDVWAMKVFYQLGKTNSNKEDMSRALELMSLSDSPTAQYYHFRLTHSRRDLDTRQGMLVHARYVIENPRLPFQTDEEFSRQTYLFRSNMDSLRAAGNRGDPDALWVLGQLD